MDLCAGRNRSAIDSYDFFLIAAKSDPSIFWMAIVGMSIWHPRKVPFSSGTHATPILDVIFEKIEEIR